MAHGLEPEYVISCHTRTPQESSPPVFQEIGELKPVGLISYAKELNHEGELAFSVEPEVVEEDVADKLVDLKRNPLEAQVYRDGESVWRGPILSCQLQGPTLTINGRGKLYYTRYMTLESSFGASNVDEFVIARGLVDAYQNLPFGHYGLDTSDTNTSGVTRIRHYDFLENHNVFQRLQELADIGGFDYWVTDSGEFKLSTMRGTDKTLTIYADVQNIIDPSVFWSVSAEKFGSVALAVGFSDGTPGVWKLEQGDISEFGRATSFVSAEDVSQQATINKYAEELIASITEQVFEPGPSVNTSVDGNPTTIEPGDTISYVIKIGRLKLFNIQRRIAMHRTTVHEDGAETQELEFV